MPEITWIGTQGHNFWPGRDGHDPMAIVNHVQMGGKAATRQSFADPAHQASATFGLNLDGTIDQFVQLGDSAWSNGPVRNPNLAAVPWIGDLCVGRGINPNRLTISIEWEGAHKGGRWVSVTWQGVTLPVWQPGSDGVWWQPTEVQYQAGLWLHRQLIAQFGIKPDRAHICRHSDFDSVSKPFCPGEGFPMERLLADLTGTPGPAPASAAQPARQMLHIDMAAQRAKTVDVYGAPGVSREHYIRMFNDVRSPAAPWAGQIWDICLAKYRRPEVIFLIFGRESHWGTDPNSACVKGDLKNPGDMVEPHTWNPGPHTMVGRFMKFPDWPAGFQALCDMFGLGIYQDPATYKPGLPNTLLGRISILAPYEDGNDPAAYTQFIEDGAAKYMAAQDDFDYPAPVAA